MKGTESPAADDRTIGFTETDLVLAGGTLYVSPDHEPIKGNVLVRDGRIVKVGTFDPPNNARLIDVSGHCVYAGFIDSAKAMTGESSEKATPVQGRTVDVGRHILAATRPDNRKGITPEFQTAGGYSFKSEELEKRRRAGFTSMHLVPAGGLMSGQTCLIALQNAPRREQVLSPAIMSAWHVRSLGGDSYPATLMGAVAHLRQTLIDSERHERQTLLYADGLAARPPVDPALNAIQETRRNKQTVLFHARSRDDVDRSLKLADEYGLNPSLWTDMTGEAAVQKTLIRRSVPLMIRIDFGDEPEREEQDDDSTLSVKLPEPLRVFEDRHDRWEQRIASLAILHEANVPFAVSGEGVKDAKTILTNLRRCVAAGLPVSAGLAALTTAPAEFLGVDRHLGRIEPGYLAHLIVMTGPWEHSDSLIRHSLIEQSLIEFNKEAELVDLSKPDEAEIDVTGQWTITLAGNEKQTGTLELVQTDARLTGQFENETGEGRVRSGKVQGRHVEFVVELEVDETRFDFEFSGELAEDGQLSGESKSLLGSSIRWTGQPLKNASPGKDPENSSAEENIAGSGTQIQPTELESDRVQRSLRTGGNLLIRDATVLPVSGPTQTATSILVLDGKIHSIGRNLTAPEGIATIDGTGLHVMPGIIDTHSHIMIDRGINEATLSLVPEVRVRDVVRSDDPSEYRALAGGTTTARLLHGSANVVGGQDAVVKLKYGTSAADHLVPDSHIGVKFALGENVKYRTSRFPNTRMGVEATLNRAFLEAVDYRRQWMQYRQALRSMDETKRQSVLAPRRDLRLEALADIIDHQKFIHSHCYRADEILMLLRVASQLGIRVWSLQHVLEGYKIAPEIVAHGASCSTFSDWWAYKVEAYDATPYNAALLQEAGANVVIKSDDAELIRHMNREAAKTVRYGGLTEIQALRTITLNSARELGLDDRLGSIEVGKEADFAIFNGHPLSSFSRCVWTVIDGEIFYHRNDVPTAMPKEIRDRTRLAPEFRMPDHPARRRGLQWTRSPARRYAITGATLHPVDRSTMTTGTLLVDDGRITRIDENTKVPTGFSVIQADGLHVYPGLIDSGSTLGLTEIRRVRETNDYSESGGIQPDLRAGVAINPDSELFPVARAGGITLSLIRPSSGLIAGQASLVQLSGWTAPEMVERLESALVVNWPREAESEQLDELREFIELARRYDKRKQQNTEDPPIADPRLEAMLPYLNGNRPIVVEADRRDQIAEALLFADQQELRIIIAGAGDAWKMAKELRTRDIPVILGPIMRRPLEAYDPQDAPYANAARLHAAGVRFSIRSDSASNSRNAPFEAGMAVAYGLPEEEAIKALTLSAAEIFDLDQELGSLTVGKRANLIILDGSPLQQTSMVHAIMIDGEPYSPESRHTRLYRRYRQRLQIPPASASQK